MLWRIDHGANVPGGGGTHGIDHVTGFGNADGDESGAERGETDADAHGEAKMSG